jgi:hypothetical protein
MNDHHCDIFVLRLPTVATVIQVDHQQGLVHLETERGGVLTFARPEDIVDLQEGDQIQVCLAAAEAEEQLPYGKDTDQ